MSWPISPPHRTVSGIASAASTARSSATRAGSSHGSVTKSGRTCGVATTVPVPWATAARASSRLSSVVSGPSSTPGQQMEVQLDPHAGHFAPFSREIRCFPVIDELAAASQRTRVPSASARGAPERRLAPEGRLERPLVLRRVAQPGATSSAG